MRCFVMFVTAVCILFLLKLKWPKNKSFYDLVNLGTIKVGDLITDNTLFLHEDPYVPISLEKRFFIMGAVHSLPLLLHTCRLSLLTKPLFRDRQRL